jgi:cobalt-zinc-cadmium efflux system outer membrane protein
MAMSTLPGDDMTMKMIGVSQTIPYPGKPGLRRRIAELELNAAVAAIQVSSLDAERDVKKSYFELAYLDRAIEIVNQNQPILADVIRVAEMHYAAGLTGQQDVLKARVEATRLGETASALLEQRRSVLAELNGLLDRESTTPVGSAQIPERVARAALASDPARIRFATQVLGSRAADSPLPPLATLQEIALNQNGQLRERQAMIAAQSKRVALAEKAVKPDVDLSLQYGQRNQRPDMISAIVSIPLPIHKHARQDEETSEARSELAAMQAEQTREVNKVRAEVARLVSDLERNRTQLALYAKAILPQSQAAVSSSLASYQAGKSDLLSVLDNQGTLFAYETANYRALVDFAKTLADLEAVVGGEVLP